MLLLAAPAFSRAADNPLAKRGLEGLTVVPLEKLTDGNLSPLGQRALQITPAAWQHAETENFVYHFFNTYVATPVAVEAEFYYRVIAKDLDRETAEWERKCHIFIFEEPAAWAKFQTAAQLDPWTGGLHVGGELFLLRDRSMKFKGHTLGHEVSHLVLHRFFGSGIPRWLDEGYAEYSSILGYSAFQRARGFDSRPRSSSIAPEDFIPLRTLTGMVGYPTETAKVATFYAESERLVRFLTAAGGDRFRKFLDAMSRGNRIETALSKAYSGVYSSLDDLEKRFRPYSAKDHQ